MAVSDEELFSRHRSGDASSFEELLERYRRPLYTVIRRMVRDSREAEDIFQETFCRVLRSQERFDAKRRFSSWIYAIATNLCRDYWRRQGRETVTADGEPPEVAGPGDPEAESSDGEIRMAVETAVARLPVEQREVFLLREYGGLTFKEIAEVTQSNLNTVLGRMHLAVKKLRAELLGFQEALR